MSVATVMTENPACCTPSTALSDVARLMVDNDCGEIPVVEDMMSRKLAGVITDRDVVVRGAARGAFERLRAADVMSTPVVTCAPSDELARVVELMAQHQKSRVLCVESDGRVCGVISLADVAQVADDYALRVIRAIAPAARSA